MHQRIKNSQAIQPGAGIEWQIPPKPKSKSECALFILGDTEQAEFFAEMLDRMHTTDFELAFSKKMYSFQGRSLIFKDTNLQIESFPNYHCMDSSGFIIHIGDKRVIYSGDIKNPQIIADVIGSEQ